MNPYLNISAYRFTPLQDLPALRGRLLEHCRKTELKGTILLSPEGINLFVAGMPAEVTALLGALRTVPGLADLAAKESASAEQPFHRMLVKIKREIIAFGVAGIDPARRPTAKLAPRVLKQWLDEQRDIVLLDTRNEYEVRMGTFRGAQRTGIAHFREFPGAAGRLPEELKERPIVMFCTGGIRCEKAGPFLEQAGFRKVFQLDGGILKYFEECGGAHYDGECFVFDRRVGVDAALCETKSVLCYNCQMPLREAEQRHPHYVPDHSCPHCFGRTGNRGHQAQGACLRPVGSAAAQART